jgi:hypothetical protein
VLTLSHVTVIAANRAQAFTVFPAKRRNWDFENQVFARKGFKIDIAIIAQDQIGFGSRAVIKGVKVAEFCFERMGNWIKTANALRGDLTTEFTLDKNTLRCPADAYQSGKIVQFYIVVQDDMGEFEVDIAVITDLRVDYKTNVDAERVTGKVHSNKLVVGEV